MKYKHSLLKTMLNRGFKLSSDWQFFHQECERLKEIFTHLHYPESLIQNTTYKTPSGPLLKLKSRKTNVPSNEHPKFPLESRYLSKIKDQRTNYATS